MERQDKLTKTEKILLGLTAAFLCVLLALHLGGEKSAVTVEREAAPEEIVPVVEPLDLNTAAAAELTDLPGIGEELADRILEYREEHGPFETTEALMEVSGIGEGKFSALEGLITVK